MSIKTMLLPLAASVGSLAFLIRQHSTQDPVRQQTRLFRETIQTVTTHRTEVKAKSDAASRAVAQGKAAAGSAKPTRADIDLKELAKLMSGMGNGTMPDMKAMLKLQKTLVELSREEIAALITDAAKLDFPAEQRDGLVMMLIQGLAESDPKAAVMAAGEFMKTAPKSQSSMLSFTMRNAFSHWAKKDLAGALTWFDGAVAAGQFESTALDDVNQEQTQLISGVLKQLWEKDPAAARQRLLALPEKERTAVLTSTNGFESNEASQKQFSELVRGILPEKEQVDAFKQLAERVYGKDSLEGVSKFFSNIAATPEERTALIAGVAESSLRRQMWGDTAEKPTLEKTTKLRTWLAAEDAAAGESTLGKSLALSLHNYGGYRSADVLALVTDLHTAQPSDALLISFLEQSKPESAKEAWQTLAGKIRDPTARAAALEKLANP